MRRFSAACVALTLLACNPQSSAGRPEPVTAEPPPLAPVVVDGARPASALVELFTSEGCSSCPPADENLAAITEAAQARGERVFTLELHVDYWDHLGWVDPFSSRVHSQRQQAYAKRFGASGMYTPQMVVNGRDELVGSNTVAARAAIERALEAPSTVAVSVQARRSATAIEVSYEVATKAPIELQLAVAAESAETQVTRGENAQRRLVHRHVVRAFHTLHLEASGAGKWTARWDGAGAQDALFVAAYATDPHDLRVLGADSRSLAVAN